MACVVVPKVYLLGFGLVELEIDNTPLTVIACAYEI